MFSGTYVQLTAACIDPGEGELKTILWERCQSSVSRRLGCKKFVEVIWVLKVNSGWWIIHIIDYLMEPSLTSKGKDRTVATCSAQTVGETQNAKKINK